MEMLRQYLKRAHTPCRLLKKPAHGRPSNIKRLLKKPARRVPSSDGSQDEIPRHLLRWRKMMWPAFFDEALLFDGRESAVEMYTKCGPGGTVIYPIEAYPTAFFDRSDDEIS